MNNYTLRLHPVNDYICFSRLAEFMNSIMRTFNFTKASYLLAIEPTLKSKSLLRTGTLKR